jgi:hypothetical protein
MVFEGKDGFLFSCTYRTFAAVSVGGREPHTKAVDRLPSKWYGIEG